MEDDIASVDSELMVEFVSLQEARVNLDGNRVALEKHQTGGRRVAPAGASRASSRNRTDRSYDLMSRGAEAEEDTEEARLNDSIRQLETVVNEIEQRRTRLKEKQMEPMQNLFEFVESLDGLQTEEDFLEHAKSVVQPAIEKYRAIFVAEGGDHVELKRAMNACKLFDPFFLATADIEVLYLLADDLPCFGNGYPEFQKADFIANLKAEIPKAVEHAKKPFDWDATADSKQYEDRARRRKLLSRKRVAEAQLGQNAETASTSMDSDGREPTFENWMQDPGERARRIYLWRRSRFMSNKTTFKYFLWALRLIVLLQASSAEIERVFSQLTMIVRLCESATWAKRRNLLTGLLTGLLTRLLTRLLTLTAHINSFLSCASIRLMWRICGIFVAYGVLWRIVVYVAYCGVWRI
jgi:hypothetical protein